MQLQPDQAALIIELSTARTSDTNNKAHRTESTWTHPINLTTSLTTCGTKYRAGQTMRHALLLIAHGSRDPAWKKPFEAIAEQLARTHEGPVVLCYLESASPSMAQGLALLLAEQPQQVTVVPLFLASGSHVRVDIPEFLAQARLEHPNLHWRLLPTLGELLPVQQAIAAAVQAQL